MGNNSGIIRSLKKLNKNSNADLRDISERKSNVTFVISALALIISVLSLYLQFFYESHNLKASLIDANIKKDSISLDLIYQNKGTQDATVISSHIFFSSYKNRELKKYHIEFINRENDNSPPVILAPGKQALYKLIQKVYFNEKGLLESKGTTKQDTLRVYLSINYINGNSLQSENNVECGWITLDSLGEVKHWTIDYQNIELNSNEYFSRGYNYKK
ncbi:hypothetical protein [Olivibacter sp. XZL3]|uniref:hypothetical protein n=1 Tax=Olivibacter sp. XZL3 TaxID=1735116 RepID=UPI001066BC2E|nr:hypothetical protein [Olivibacter sp. XZL3]